MCAGRQRVCVCVCKGAIPKLLSPALLPPLPPPSLCPVRDAALPPLPCQYEVSEVDIPVSAKSTISIAFSPHGCVSSRSLPCAPARAPSPLPHSGYTHDAVCSSVQALFRVHPRGPHGEDHLLPAVCHEDGVRPVPFLRVCYHAYPYVCVCACVCRCWLGIAARPGR